jgi:arsenate reductase (glutaredoxin)
MSSRNFKIYHNPRCSKSRQTLELLKGSGIEPEIVEYLKTPLNHQELEQILKKLDVGAHEILRTKEPEFLSLNIDVKDDSAVLSAIITYPKILERPIVVTDTQAVIGRPPDNIYKLIELSPLKKM